MVRKAYVPRRGDIVWLNFTPQSGHEQKGQRPAMVLSPESYNEKVGLGLFCPITTKRKGYPFEVTVSGRKIQGVVLADQVKSLDWRSREATFAERAGGHTIEEVLGKVQALLTH